MACFLCITVILRKMFLLAMYNHKFCIRIRKYKLLHIFCPFSGQVHCCAGIVSKWTTEDQKWYYKEWTEIHNNGIAATWVLRHILDAYDYIFLLYHCMSIASVHSQQIHKVYIQNSQFIKVWYLYIMYMQYTYLRCTAYCIVIFLCDCCNYVQFQAHVM